MEISEKLKELRKERNLTQQEVADKVYMDRTLITKYESGHIIPTNENLEKLAVFYNISVAELVGSNETTKMTLKNASFIRKFKMSLSILEMIFSVLFVVFLIVPIFTYGKYMYPIPEGQTVPSYITGNTSILNATIKIGNPIAFISIIASMLQVALSFGSILPVNDKTQERIRLAQNILFALLLILCFLSFAFGIISINGSTSDF